MGRSRYTITEADKPHSMTCTVMEWLPVFTRPETVQILTTVGDTNFCGLIVIDTW